MVAVALAVPVPVAMAMAVVMAIVHVRLPKTNAQKHNARIFVLHKNPK